MLQCLEVPPHALAVGVTPSTPQQLLVLGTRDRLGGTLPSVSSPPVSFAPRVLLGFSSPSSSQSRPTLWCVSPWLSSPAEGPALAGPLSDASDTFDASKLYSRRAMLGPGAVDSIEVLGWVPCAAVFCRLLHRLVRRRRPAALIRAVYAIGPLTPGCLGGGWVFVPSSPDPNYSPPVGIGTL